MLLMLANSNKVIGSVVLSVAGGSGLIFPFFFFFSPLINLLHCYCMFLSFCLFAIFCSSFLRFVS